MDDTKTYTPLTPEESMALPKHEYIERCKAWLDEFNDGNQIEIENSNDCPLQHWIIVNHANCGKDLVPLIEECPICGMPCCPDCGNHSVTQLSRVTGYVSDVSGWNASKKQELKDRTRYNVSRK